MQGVPPAPTADGRDLDVRTTRILFVCTANQCRSVMAEALARRRFAGRAFGFASAGLLEGGRPVPPNGILVAAEHGFDLSAHTSRRVDRATLDQWDLVLTMTREQSRELVAADAGLWPRVFTLPQFARWLTAHRPPRHAAIRPWVELDGAQRDRSEMVGSSLEDDVSDPVDGPPDEWRQLLGRLDQELAQVASHLIA